MLSDHVRYGVKESPGVRTATDRRRVREAFGDWRASAAGKVAAFARTARAVTQAVRAKAAEGLTAPPPRRISVPAAEVRQFCAKHERLGRLEAHREGLLYIAAPVKQWWDVAQRLENAEGAYFEARLVAVRGRRLAPDTAVVVPDGHRLDARDKAGLAKLAGRDKATVVGEKDGPRLAKEQGKGKGGSEAVNGPDAKKGDREQPKSTG